MYLYEWRSRGGSCQRYFVVADSYAEAERTIKSEYGHFVSIESIENVGKYVLVAKDVLASQPSDEGGIEE